MLNCFAPSRAKEKLPRALKYSAGLFKTWIFYSDNLHLVPNGMYINMQNWSPHQTGRLTNCLKSESNFHATRKCSSLRSSGNKANVKVKRQRKLLLVYWLGNPQRRINWTFTKDGLHKNSFFFDWYCVLLVFYGIWKFLSINFTWLFSQFCCFGLNDTWGKLFIFVLSNTYWVLIYHKIKV